MTQMRTLIHDATSEAGDGEICRNVTPVGFATDGRAKVLVVKKRVRKVMG